MARHKKSARKDYKLVPFEYETGIIPKLWMKGLI